MFNKFVVLILDPKFCPNFHVAGDHDLAQLEIAQMGLPSCCLYNILLADFPQCCTLYFSLKRVEFCPPPNARLRSLTASPPLSRQPPLLRPIFAHYATLRSTHAQPLRNPPVTHIAFYKGKDM